MSVDQATRGQPAPRSLPHRAVRKAVRAWLAQPTRRISQVGAQRWTQAESWDGSVCWWQQCVLVSVLVRGYVG